METVSKEKLKDYASKLMFDMKDEEYLTLQNEFEVILKQMDLISKIKNISEVEPMTFPFEMEGRMREDKENNVLTSDEALKNAGERLKDEVKVPKVVGADE